MKRLLKAAFAALLTFSMVLSLAGCGGDDGENDAQAKKEFYYVPEFHDLDIQADYIENSVAIGDKLYMFGSSWDEDTGESSNFFYQYDLLSGDISELAIEIDKNSSIQQLAADSGENLVMIVSRYAPVTEGAGSEDSGTKADTDESADTASAAESSAALEGDVEKNYEPVEYESYLELWKVSAADGSVLSKEDIRPVFENPDRTYAQYMVLDDKDNIYIADGERNIYIMDQSGKKLGSTSTENWVENLFASKEGQVYIRSWGNEGIELRPVDFQSKSLGEPIKSESLGINGYNQTYYKGAEKGVLVSDGNSVFNYDFETDVKEDLFAWLDADINSDDVSEMGQLSDGRFWTLLQNYSGENRNYSIALLKKTPASEAVQKEEILYGTMWLDQSVRKNIINFNKSSDKYHISVKEYAADDYGTGLTLFNNDITSGNGPDIIDISNIDFKQYASKGVFEDIYPYMEKDGIHKEDYLENVLKAFEVDGKLYGIVPQFYISTTIAKASKVGDTPGWTLSEMLDFAESSNAENIFQYGNRMGIFYYCIYNNIDEFIDWESGECKFNSDDFIRVLEFANQFPEEADYNNEEGTSAMLRSDKVLLMQATLSSVEEYQMMNGLFGEKTTYIGYPNSERKGNLIQPVSGCVALNAKSKNKDGAWEFIKTLLSDEYQSSLTKEWGSWGFPVKKSALDKQFENNMTPKYYEDENGNQVEQMKTSWGYDDFSIDIYAASQEEIDAVKEIIASAERTAGSVNEELTNIISEETEAFFKGQKSAKDTADIIQNRIQIYVNENG